MKMMWAALGRLLNIFHNGILIGTACASVLYLIMSVVLSLTDDPGYLRSAGLFLICAAVCLPWCCLIFVGSKFHKHDADLIGDSFVGFSRKCRLFAKSLDELFNRRLNYALNGFKLLESDYADKTDPEEKAVISFYIGRCYEQMNYFPNALRYYEAAAEQGLRHKILPFITARCCGSMGDTEDALRRYSRVLSDESSPFRVYVRTDVGRMYLRQNDGESALRWYSEAIERHENFSDALGGASVACILLHDFDRAEELHRRALLNNIRDSRGYIAYYKTVKDSVMQESAGA